MLFNRAYKTNDGAIALGSVFSYNKFIFPVRYYGKKSVKRFKLLIFSFFLCSILFCLDVFWWNNRTSLFVGVFSIVTSKFFSPDSDFLQSNDICITGNNWLLSIIMDLIILITTISLIYLFYGIFK